MRMAGMADLPRGARLAGEHDSAVLEREIAFDMELSVICARDAGGAIAFYDSPQNIHRGGILRESIAPAPISAEIGAIARDYAGRIAEALDYVGVLAVEMFLTGERGHATLAHQRNRSPRPQ